MESVARTTSYHGPTDGVYLCVATVYGSNAQVDTLRQMRKHRVDELREVAKDFPQDAQVYARVVNGGPERQILFAAEETVSPVTSSVLQRLISTVLTIRFPAAELQSHHHRQA